MCTDMHASTPTHCTFGRSLWKQVQRLVTVCTCKEFLDAFEKLPKATASFVMSVGLSVRPSAWTTPVTTGEILMKFDIWVSKSTEKIQFSLKCGKSNGYFTGMIRCMRLVCRITKAKNTHSEYNILTAFTQQQWLLERSSVLRCTYSACLAMCWK
jgi:hypothetical protein